MQPYIEVDGGAVPLLPRRKASQIAALERTLGIAKAADHGAGKTHFTVIPEYSIPGPEGIARVETIRHPSWPCGTVVIGGTDALCKNEYTRLCDEEHTAVDDSNAATRVGNDEWVNCCITWVKAANGDLPRWLQPKIAPALHEQNTHNQGIFSGRLRLPFPCGISERCALPVFSPSSVRLDGGPGWPNNPRQVLDKINDKAKEDVYFVGLRSSAQSRSHATSDFLGGDKGFFQDQADCPFVHRRTAVGFCKHSREGQTAPGKCHHGCSSHHFFPSFAI